MKSIRTPLRTGVCAALLALLAAGCGSSATPAPEPAPPSSSASSSTALSPLPSSASASPSGPASTSAAPTDARWQAKPGDTWQWQLTTPVDLSVDASVYDIDGFENGPDVVSALHAKGRKVICYINVGAYEDFRPDKASFSSSLLGKGNNWPGERWLDIRRLDQIEPLMAKRFDMCRAKGFDAVEPDQLDAYANDSGFPLTAADQLAFNRMIARLAHDRGLAVGLKNDLDQVEQLVGDFDFAVNEQCAQYSECEQLGPFVAAGKAVFQAEYDLETGKFCTESRGRHFSAIRKHLKLDAWREAC